MDASASLALKAHGDRHLGPVDIVQPPESAVVIPWRARSTSDVFRVVQPEAY